MYTYTRFIDLGMVEEAGPSGGEMWRNPLLLRDCRLVPQSPFRELRRFFRVNVVVFEWIYKVEHHIPIVRCWF